MAYTKFSDNYYYKNGEGGHSTVIGYESKANRVLRVKFKTGSSGATNISINVTAGTISNQDGTDITKIAFYVTESSTSHANANEADGYAVTGHITGSSKKAYSGSANVVLKADTDYYVWFFPVDKTYGWSYWHRNGDYYWSEYETSGTSKFALTISAGTGSSITVNRTASDVGMPTGVIASGSTIYKNDRLQITFTADSNYAIKTRTVNGASVTSGNTHTVSGNVSVASTAQVLASDVGATDANIGSVSTITVTKYSSAYYHTLQYEFGSLSGYITSSGGVSPSAVRFTGANIPFSVPTSFYAQIPNDPTGKCKITCRTYENSSSSAQLGKATTCEFTVTAANSNPQVVGTIVDTNQDTIGLTGDSSKLIRYRSSARCTVTATPQNSSSISSVRIGGVALTGTQSGGIVTASKTYQNVDIAAFEFGATDSRGYPTDITLRPTIVEYIALTCVPQLYRPTPTGSSIEMILSGNFYRGSFGALSNRLTVQYQYKEVGQALYKDWQTISSGISSSDGTINIYTTSYQTSRPYVLKGVIIAVENPSVGEIGEYYENVDGEYVITSDTELVEGKTYYRHEPFDYHKDYVFKIRVFDGNGDYILSDESKEVRVNRGIPVFDWGESDFNVNVALMLKNTNILDIIFPVGCVYTHSSNSMPGVVSGVGTWTSVSTGISGVYAWKRTA